MSRNDRLVLCSSLFFLSLSCTSLQFPPIKFQPDKWFDFEALLALSFSPLKASTFLASRLLPLEWLLQSLFTFSRYLFSLLEVTAWQQICRKTSDRGNYRTMAFPARPISSPEPTKLVRSSPSLRSLY